MIGMAHPSFVFHAYDVSPKFYIMWHTVRGKPRETVYGLVAHIFSANAAAIAKFGTGLKNVILNMHGSPGSLSIGGLEYTSTITDDITPFGMLKNIGIGTIWIVSCSVAKNSPNGDGRIFCHKLADLTNCIVVASAYDQHVDGWDGFALIMYPLIGGIDSYEGELIAFHPGGKRETARDPAVLVNTLAPPEEVLARIPPQRPPM